MIHLNGNDPLSNNNYLGGQQFSSQPKSLITKNDSMETDSVSFSSNTEKHKNKNKNNLTAYIIGVLALIVGCIILAVNLKKGKTNSGDVAKDIKRGVEGLGKHDETVLKQKSEIKTKPSQNSSSVGSTSVGKRDNSQFKRGQEGLINAKKTLEDVIKVNEEVKKKTAEEELFNEKIEKDLKKINEWIKEEKENLKRMDEEFNKFYDDAQDAWEKSQAKREQYWQEFHSKYFNNDIDGSLIEKFKNKAKHGLEIFRSFGKDPVGKTFDEVSILDSTDGITTETLKKAHWKLYKKYGPILNTGTEEEKIEATRIMQQINSANDDIRAYIEIKQK